MGVHKAYPTIHTTPNIIVVDSAALFKKYKHIVDYANSSDTIDKYVSLGNRICPAIDWADKVGYNKLHSRIK